MKITEIVDSMSGLYNRQIWNIVAVGLLIILIGRIYKRYTFEQRMQRIEIFIHPSPFIRALQDRVIHHTQDLSDENPIKSLAQKYLYLQQAQSLKDRIFSWIPFVWR